MFWQFFVLRFDINADVCSWGEMNKIFRPYDAISHKTKITKQPFNLNAQCNNDYRPIFRVFAFGSVNY